MPRIPSRETIETEGPTRETERPTRRVFGEVRIKGTDMPVSGMVAHAYAVSATSDSGDDEYVSLGSALVERGRFEIRYADELIASPSETRPSIRVKLFGADAELPLAESDLRASAAPQEVFLLTVDAEALAEQGRAEALNAAARSADPTVAAQAVAAKRNLAERRSREVGAERRATVAQRHRDDAELDAIVRERALSELTGVSPNTSAWMRMVPPGKDPVEIANAYQKEAIETVIASQVEEVGAETYLLLSEADYDELGNPPDPEKVIALLRGTRADGGIVRDDPILRLCRTTNVPDPFADAPPDPAPAPAPLPGPGVSADAKVKELVGSIEPPDNIQLTGPRGRDRSCRPGTRTFDRQRAS